MPIVQEIQKIESKTCRRCVREYVVATGFYRHPQGKDGHTNICIVCIKERHALWREGTREQNRVKTLEWRRSNPERQRAACNNWRLNHPAQRLFQTARQRARDNNLVFDLTPEDVVIPDVCPVLGIPIKSATGYQSYNSPSIDQVEPGKGYTKTNTCVISWRANRLKNNGTLIEIEAIARYMRKHADSNRNAGV